MNMTMTLGSLRLRKDIIAMVTILIIVAAFLGQLMFQNTFSVSQAIKPISDNAAGLSVLKLKYYFSWMPCLTPIR